jgi:hypothetical protein
MFMILAILTIATCTYRIQMREVGLSGPSLDYSILFRGWQPGQP